MLHVLFICGFGWVSWPVCINTGLAAFKHFDPLIHTSLWQTVLSTLGSQLSVGLCPFHSFRHQKLHHCILLVLGAKPLVEQSSLHHAHSAQTDYNWTTLAESHHLTLSYSMTRPQQRCQSCNENIPILPLLFFNLFCTYPVFISVTGIVWNLQMFWLAYVDFIVSGMYNRPKW
jgi:hypothetical protein